MRNLLLPFFLFIGIVIQASDGLVKPAQLIDYTLVKHLTLKDLKAYYKKNKIPKTVFPVNNGVNIYEIVYSTTNYDSSIVKVSGLVYVPITKNKVLSKMIYNHGTETCTGHGPMKGERAICIVFAADEYIVLAPDYIGLGKSELDQLYLHAYTESHTAVDMLIASELLFTKLNIETEKDVFVAGYSQGAHATMATHRLLQNEYKDVYPVKASAPMSGPYDVEGSLSKGINRPYVHPSLLVLLLKTYFVVNNQPDNFQKTLVKPYDTLLPPLFHSNYSFFEIDKLLPNVAGDMVNKSFAKDVETNPESQLRKYAQKNNVYDWKPETPMQLCYCDADKDVSHLNTLKAYETMKKNGSDKVVLKNAGKKFEHINCALFSTVYTKTFFDGYRKGKPAYRLSLPKRTFVNTMKLILKP